MCTSDNLDNNSPYTTNIDNDYNMYNTYIKTTLIITTLIITS